MAGYRPIFNAGAIHHHGRFHLFPRGVREGHTRNERVGPQLLDYVSDVLVFTSADGLDYLTRRGHPTLFALFSRCRDRRGFGGCRRCGLLSVRSGSGGARAAPASRSGSKGRGRRLARVAPTRRGGGRVLCAYTVHYNRERPHRGLALLTPERASAGDPPTAGQGRAPRPYSADSSRRAPLLPRRFYNRKIARIRADDRPG